MPRIMPHGSEALISLYSLAISGFNKIHIPFHMCPKADLDYLLESRLKIDASFFCAPFDSILKITIFFKKDADRISAVFFHGNSTFFIDYRRGDQPRRAVFPCCQLDNFLERNPHRQSAKLPRRAGPELNRQSPLCYRYISLQMLPARIRAPDALRTGALFSYPEGRKNERRNTLRWDAAYYATRLRGIMQSEKLPAPSAVSVLPVDDMTG